MKRLTRVGLIYLPALLLAFMSVIQVGRGSLGNSNVAAANGSDFCLQDDTTGANLSFSSTTGNYQFCCPGRSPISGVGRVFREGCYITLVQGGSETLLRLLAKVDTCTNKAKAAVQSFSGGYTCTIIDRNITNNQCGCGREW